MVYIIAFLFSLFFLCCSLHSKKEGKWLFYVASTLPLTLLSAFRYQVGTDYYQTYELGFISMKNGYEVDGYDWGFSLLNKLILAMTHNPQWLFVITSFAISFFIFRAVKTFSVNALLSYYVYFCGGMYFMGMNQLKQFLGMSVCLYSIRLFMKREYFLLVVCMVVAGSFHTVNYVFLIPFLLLKIPRFTTFIKPLYVVILLVGSYLVANVLISYFFNEILVFTRFYNRYAYSEVSFTEGNFSLAYFVMNLFVLSLFFLVYKENKNKEQYILFYCFKILSTFLVLLSGQMMIVARLSDTYLIADVVSIPYVISKVTNKYLKRLALFGVLALYGYYWYWSIVSLNNHGGFPYDFRLP